MNWFRRKWEATKGLFEAARKTFSDQSYLFGKSHTDAWVDYTQRDREEIVSNHRYWVANSDLVQRIRSLFIQFSVGPTGLNCVPNSKDETWNALRSDNWAAWCRRPEISSRHNMTALVIQWAGSLFDDGEFFILKLQDKGRPYIQSIEAHRCKTPASLKEKEGKSIIDGVEIDANMRPVAYWFLDDSDASGLLGTSRDLKFKRVVADMVIHGFKSRRPGMIRGIPEGVSAHSTLHHYQDLHKLEMRVAKKIASTAIVITNDTGEANPNTTRRERMLGTTQNGNGDSVSRDRSSYYENKYGGETVYARKGEKVEGFKCDRPSVVQQQYWDLLLSQICCGYNTPKLLVVPYSLQGTVTRADLDVCTGAFRFNFEIVAGALREIYEWQTEWAVKFDRQMDGKKPEQYLEVVIRPPRPPDVDVGYNANAKIAELKSGLVTYQDLYAERQQDWRQQFRQAAEAEFYKKQLAKEFSRDGITVSAEEIALKLDQVVVAVPDIDGSAVNFDTLKQQFEAVGVGVRAGVITPTPNDEVFFRQKAGLPAISKQALSAWSEENDVRRPITLTNPADEQPGAAQMAATADTIEE